VKQKVALRGKMLRRQMENLMMDAVLIKINKISLQRL
jgi:hypothetical protein